MRPTRRHLLGGLGAGLMLPRLALAETAEDRVFLFLYVEGGWDPAFVFTPLFGTDAYEEEGASISTAHGLTFVDHPNRPAVKFFFDDWGSDICVLNGLEVPSITHERCTQLLLTGGTGGDADWPTRISAGNYVMPHLVLDGPAFTGDTPERIVRVGDSNQLARLLSNDLGPYSSGASPLSGSVESLVDAHVLARAQNATGARSAHSGLYASSLEGLGRLQEEAAGLSFAEQTLGCTRDFEADFEVVFDAFEAGITRCAMLRHRGWCNQGWDTHQNLWIQSDNFEDLFFTLYTLQTALSSRPDLKERLVLVVASEMGRHPQVNAWGGKDHWTWTSTMLMGSGVSGGVVLGGLDDLGRGRGMDLATGAVDDAGTRLLPQHLGATLLELAGLPTDDVAPPITAALD
ncbi:MAG: DUF1501 domain-containing protein [Proteobacteria bacterium]|nr:DUF1501 domain-containing protein [Pseudomonadota bacterium]MCP4917295.1 DUF1501 domain-containing protein [Pseudomonadota bacterium]